METNNPKNHLHSLKIIHFSLLAFPVFASLFVLWNNMGTSSEVEGEMKFLQLAPSVLLLIVFLISGTLFNTIYRNSVGSNPNLRKKMAAYSSAHIAKMALYEGIALFAVVVSYLTGSIYNLGLIVLIIFIFLKEKPSIVKLEDRLNLSPEEREQFN